MTLDPDAPALLAEKGMGFTAIAAAPGSSQRIARDHLDSLTIEFRVIDACQAETRTTLFGCELTTPIMVTALSALDRVREGGMAAAARGAAAAGAAMWVGVGTDDELARVVDSGVAAVKIVKPYRDRDLILRKLEKAASLGVRAVGMDVSYAFGMKNGYAPAPMAPQSLADLRAWVAATPLPFVVKGVLSERDAAKAREAGAAAVMLSHQGGTVLDSAVAPARLLPKIAGSLNPEMAVFADCAVRSGLDAFKLMALGADGVGVGTAVMEGLAAEGADGVTRVLESMTAELGRAMSLTGMAGVGDMDPTVLWPVG